MVPGEKTPIIEGARRNRAVVRTPLPTHLGGTNTSAHALVAAIATMFAMFVVVTLIGPGSLREAGNSALSERPRLEHVGEQSVEVIWEKPAQPIGVLFLAHGCNHKATDFWPKSSHCNKCLGLPEERRIVKKALKKRYAVVAVSSMGPCWSPEVDGGRVKMVLEHVLKREDLTGKPLYAFGASSGGSFVSVLPFIMKVDGIVSQIAAVHLPRAESKAEFVGALKEQGGDGTYPPTVFSHMGGRDEMTGSLVKDAMATLKTAGVPVRETVLEPQPIDDTFFSTRIPKTVSDAESNALAAALRHVGLVNSKGFLTDDPRSSEWRTAVSPHASEDTLVPDHSAIAEVLNVAYALHELTADHFDDDLKWLEGEHHREEKAAVAADNTQG